MRSVPFGILCSAAAMSIAAPAFAASDYFLIIDGVDGEATTAVQVESWSWGASNAGSAARGGDVKVSASQNTQTLRESSTGAASGRGVVTGVAPGTTSIRVMGGDVDGDGKADFASQDAVSDFRLVLASGSPATRAMCATGKHIKQAHLVKADGTVYDLSDLTIGSCDASGGMTEVKIASGKTKEFKGHVTLMK